MKVCTPSTQTFILLNSTFQMPKNKHVNIQTWITVNLIKLEFEILFCPIRVEKHVLIFLILKKVLNCDYRCN